MESDVITMQDIFEFKIDSFAPDGTINGKLQSTGLRPIFLDKFAKRGIELPGGPVLAPARRRRTSRISAGELRGARSLRWRRSRLAGESRRASRRPPPTQAACRSSRPEARSSPTARTS